MSKFRKRPIVVEAVRVSHAIPDLPLNRDALPKWLLDALEKGDIEFSSNHVLIPTREGTMRGDWDDWIIQGVHGELYPCKHDIFKATYEPEGEP